MQANQELESTNKRPRFTRSSSPSPLPNQAREERPPTGSQHQALVSLPPLSRAEKITWDFLIPYAELLRQDEDIKMTLEGIHCLIGLLCQELKLHNMTFANEEQFKENFKQQKLQFIKVLHNAVGQSANNDDRLALLKHSTCHCNGINQSTKCF
jgi:hypothetical protein